MKKRRKSSNIKYVTRVLDFNQMKDIHQTTMEGTAQIWRPNFNMEPFHNLLGDMRLVYNQARLVRVRLTLLPQFHEPTLDDAKGDATLLMPTFFMLSKKNHSEFLKGATLQGGQKDMYNIFSDNGEKIAREGWNWKPISLTHSRTFVTRPHAIKTKSSTLKDGSHVYDRSFSPWIDFDINNSNNVTWATYNSLCFLITKYNLGSFSAEEAKALGDHKLAGTPRFLRFRMITRMTIALRKIKL